MLGAAAAGLVELWPDHPAGPAATLAPWTLGRLGLHLEPDRGAMVEGAVDLGSGAAGGGGPKGDEDLDAAALAVAPDALEGLDALVLQEQAGRVLQHHADVQAGRKAGPLGSLAAKPAPKAAGPTLAARHRSEGQVLRRATRWRLSEERRRQVEELERRQVAEGVEEAGRRARAASTRTSTQWPWQPARSLEGLESRLLAELTGRDSIHQTCMNDFGCPRTSRHRDDAAMGVTKSSLMRNADDEPSSTSASRRSSTASRSSRFDFNSCGRT